MEQLREKLDQDSIQFKLWVERPEIIATCLATKPYPKNKVQSHFKKFKLLKVYNGCKDDV